MDLLNDRVRDVYFKYLAATLGSTLIMSIYSIVDTIIIGHYEGPNGTAAVAAFMPLWTMPFVFGLLFGIGGSVLMAQSRGAGDMLEGDRCFTVAIMGSIAVSALMLVLYNVLQEQLLALCGARGEVLELAVRYVRHIARAVPVFIVGQALVPFVRVDGNPAFTTLTSVVGGVLNMTGDLFFVYGLDMGIEGAGLATALGQIVAFTMLLVHLARGKSGLVWNCLPCAMVPSGGSSASWQPACPPLRWTLR